MPDPNRQFVQALEKLEFEAVRKRLQRFAISGLGESMVRDFGPITDADALAVEHSRVSEMRGLIETEDAMPIHDIRDIRVSLKRSAVENTRLDPLDFVDILLTI